MSLFNNLNILKEGKIATLTNKQQQEKDRLASRIKSLSLKPTGSMLAFIGNFGSGKTTVIDKIKKDTKPSYNWVSFDVWRYSDRNQIWEGFVIEMIAKLGNDGSLKQLGEVASDIEGDNRAGEWIKRNSAAVFVAVTIIWLLISSISWQLLHARYSPGAIFLKHLITYSLSPFLVLLAFVGVNTLFPRHKPMKRYFDFEQKLLDQINKSDKPVVVVIEDVDRVGEEGIVFLETVRQFLNNNRKLNKPFIIVAPQSNLYLNVVSENTLQGFERGIKIYDSVIYYAGSYLQPEEALKIIADAGIAEEFQELKEMFNSTVNNLIKHYKGISVRTFKFILREVDEFIKAFPQANPNIALILIASRHIKVTYDGQHSAAIDILSSKSQFIASSDQQIRQILQALIDVGGGGNIEVIVNLDFSASEEINLDKGDHNDVVLIALNDRYMMLLEK